MAMSGIKASSECSPAYEDVKHRKVAFAIFHIEKRPRDGDDKLCEMIYPEYIEKNESFIKPQDKMDNKEKMISCLDQLKAKLGAEPRYVLINIYQTIDDNNNIRDHDKMVFILWNPDGAKINNKMLYSASKDSLKNLFVGCNIDLQSSDYEDISHKVLTESSRKK